MSKLQEILDTCTKDMTGKLGMSKVDAAALKGVAKACGPSIYKADASKVACSDKAERERIKANFLIKKLGLKDTPKLDEAIEEVCKEMGSSNRNKYRVIFYYMLAQKFRKLSMFK